MLLAYPWVPNSDHFLSIHFFFISASLLCCAFPVKAPSWYHLLFSQAEVVSSIPVALACLALSTPTMELWNPKCSKVRNFEHPHDGKFHNCKQNSGPLKRLYVGCRDGYCILARVSAWILQAHTKIGTVVSIYNSSTPMLRWQTELKESPRNSWPR